ncbi:hypothetical protein [Dyella acidiphila]|uniref:Uncharacterized protein n=1 Tax=Dyella acidiphila TaxID=2775866 RepID=A0ABR9G9Q3_9GAMM|nr:hypothetical protein [Dyella acidiphila]MBE1160755.1 hypothetical protein [Dyella acidiphila]
MKPMKLEHAEPRFDLRRVSPDPVEGYVLNPWSGLYQESELAYQDRLRAGEASPA